MSKIAFLFPGQGAQKAGMGQDFYEKYPSARQVFDQASQWLSLDMKALCFEKNDRLNLTEYKEAEIIIFDGQSGYEKKNFDHNTVA